MMKAALFASVAAGLILPQAPQIVTFPKPSIVRAHNLELSRNMLLSMPMTMGILTTKKPRVALSSAYGGNGASGTNSTSYSFSGVGISTAASNRYVVVLVFAPSGGGISNVTVGGAATSLLQSSSTTLGWYITAAPYTSGTTATIAWSCVSTAIRGACYVFAVYGDPVLFHADETGAISLNIPAGGSAFAVNYLNSTGIDDAATWVNLTERHETYFDGITNITAASDDFAADVSGRAISVNWSTAGTGTGSNSAISLGPR